MNKQAVQVDKWKCECFLHGSNDFEFFFPLSSANTIPATLVCAV